MKRHPFEKSVQISGSASMFYLVKGPEKSKYTCRFKRYVGKCNFKHSESYSLKMSFAVGYLVSN